MYNYLKDLIYKNGYAQGAHRGCTSCCEENTLKSIQHAFEKGYDYIEIDVQMSKDKTIFVHHDLTIQVDGEEVPNHMCTWDQIEKSINALKLEDLFKIYENESKYFMLDIKTEPFLLGNHLELMVPEIIELLNKYQYEEKVVFISVDHQFLASIKEMDQRIMVGLIVPFVPKDPVALCKEVGAQLYLSGIRNFNQNVFKQLSGSGILLDASVIKKEEIQAMVDLGINMFELDN